MAENTIADAAVALPSQDLNGPVNVLQRYGEEASKRIRKDGLQQYIDPSQTEQYRHFLDDPWIAAGTPINEVVPNGGHARFLIFGAGFGGILFAVKLIQAGFSVEDILIVDPAGGFGGTWYWSRYPGLMCDVESYIYMPLLEDTQYIPKRKYASGEELREYCEAICKKYDLHRRVMFQCAGKTVDWDDRKKEWVAQIALKSKGGPTGQTTIHADFVFFASGVLNNAKLPNVQGFGSFPGKQFHSARWDYSYTGGTQEKPDLANLQDKKVAFIGTGATAVQAVPHVAIWAKELFIFQRTPSSVDVRDNKDTDLSTWESEVATRKGWWKERNINFVSFVNNVEPKPEVDLVNDKVSYNGDLNHCRVWCLLMKKRLTTTTPRSGLWLRHTVA